MAVAHFAYSVLKVPGPQGPMTIHGDRKGAVAYDIKTLDLIRQYRQSPMDPAEPPAKQQKTTIVAAATLVTPKVKVAPQDPRTSKAVTDQLKTLAPPAQGSTDTAKESHDEADDAASSSG